MITCREFNGFLIDYRSGDLTLDERARFETHLAECSHCVAYLRSYEETIRLAKGAFSHLDDAMTEDVPDGLVRAILAARPASRTLTQRPLLASVVLVVLAVGTVAAQLTTKGWDPEQFHKPGEAVLQQSLTPLQYQVTQQEGTEPSFHNEYWNNKQAGIYVDVVSGEPLFSSLDKFDSGTGWPSFTKLLEAKNIRTKVERSFFWERTEVRSAYADSHLGHVFDDGPPPTGLRYCMNSAALRFIPVERLKEEGYAEYLPLFASQQGAAPTHGK